MSTVPAAAQLAGADLLALVLEAAALVLDVCVDTLHGHTRLVGDLKADSLAMIEIAEVTEERLRVLGVAAVVDDDVLGELKTPDDFVQALLSSDRSLRAGGR